jgi:hypothetical protein
MFGCPLTTFPSTHKSLLRSSDEASRSGGTWRAHCREGSQGRRGGNTYKVDEIADITYISIGIVPCFGCLFQQSASIRDLIICLITKGGYRGR